MLHNRQTVIGIQCFCFKKLMIQSKKFGEFCMLQIQMAA